MVNYYKILGLDNYASVAEVKQAYKAKIKVLHPDVNPDPNAAEITQYLNQAKEHLETKDAKENYDRKLKLAYLVEIQRLQDIKNRKSVFPHINLRQRAAEMEEERKLRIKRKYEAGLQKFPFTLRVLGITLLALWGLQIIYSFYFIYFGSYDRQRIIGGFAIFSIAMVLGANEAYTRFIAKSVETPFRFNYELLISWVFVIGFFAGPSSVSALNTWRKHYHLEHHYGFVYAKINYKESYLDGTVVMYEVDGKHFKRLVDKEVRDLVRFKDGTTILKYAKVNPLICEALSPEEWNRKPLEM
jgi:curved DNA-binding protein CbpA